MITLSDLPLHARLLIKRSPYLYGHAKRLTGRGAEDHLCDSTTALCIEGYPSSGNSFSFAVLHLANPDVRLAHHCHSVANLQRALDLGIPAVCLIRDPADAIPSRLVRFGGRLREAIVEYVDFYGFALRHLDRLTIAPFEEVTQDTQAFLARVSRASGISFAVDDIESLEQRARAYIENWSERKNDIERMSLPAVERDLSKARLRETVQSHERFPEARRLWEAVAAPRLPAAAPAAPVHEHPGP